MDCIKLLEILNKGEDSKHQFKENFNSIDQLVVEISAFANSDGGVIIIGASDAGELVGISKQDVGRLNQWISNATSQKIDKQIFVKTEILICEGKRVMIINIPHGLNKPYAVNRIDVWVKSGADKRRAPIEEVLRLAQTSGLLYADELETEATINDFDLCFFKENYQKYYKEEIEKLEIPVEKLLKNLKFLKNNRLSLSGLLLCGKHPERFRPQFGIKATYFEGLEVSSQKYKDAEEIRGKLIDQYTNGISFIKRNLKRVQKNRNVNAPGNLEIPEEAFSEAIANAIIHRNYYINAPIQIYLFDDRLEVVSPGNLPNTVTEENIKFGIHIERNPTILSFLEKDDDFSYSGRGSGIPRVLKICEKEGVEVKFIDDKAKQQFKVIFKRG
ncbi:hypothetical protein ES705_12805 [subsurface metagenome]